MNKAIRQYLIGLVAIILAGVAAGVVFCATGFVKRIFEVECPNPPVSSRIPAGVRVLKLRQTLPDVHLDTDKSGESWLTVRTAAGNDAAEITMPEGFDKWLRHEVTGDTLCLTLDLGNMEEPKLRIGLSRPVTVTFAGESGLAIVGEGDLDAFGSIVLDRMAAPRLELKDIPEINMRHSRLGQLSVRMPRWMRWHLEGTVTDSISVECAASDRSELSMYAETSTEGRGSFRREVGGIGAMHLTGENGSSLALYFEGPLPGMITSDIPNSLTVYGTGAYAVKCDTVGLADDNEL